MSLVFSYMYHFPLPNNCRLSFIPRQQSKIGKIAASVRAYDGQEDDREREKKEKGDNQVHEHANSHGTERECAVHHRGWIPETI